MDGNLGTTNIILAIIAAVSVLEALLVIGIGVAAFVLYRKVSALMAVVESRHVEPAMHRVNAILDDVKGVTTKVREETDRVDHAIRTTMDRVDDTADRVRYNVRAKTSRVVGVLRGIRVAIEDLLTNGHHRTHQTRPQHP